MPRRPIQLERTGLRTPRERMWAAMLQLGRFKATQVEDAAHPATRDAVKSYLDSLVNAGFVRFEPAPRFQAATFEVIKRQALAPAVDRRGKKVQPPLGVLAMWRAMKVRKVFDADEIAADASQGGVSCTRATAKSYISALARAGYLRVDVKSQPGRQARMRLVKDTGPLAPAITRAKVVFDRNTGELMLAETAQEVGDELGC